MRIVFITSTLGPGGAERVLSGYANHLAEKNEVYIVKLDAASSSYGLNEKIQVLSLNLFSDSKNIFLGFFKNINRIKKIRKTVLQLNPHKVLSFQTSTNTLVLLALFDIRKKILVFERTNYLFPLKFIWRSLRKCLYRFASKIIVLSGFDLKYYKKINPQTHILQNPLLLNAPQSLNFETKENIILAMGRFDDNKRYEKLIEIFASVKDKRDYKLLIVGGGPLKDRYLSLIEKLNANESIFIENRTDFPETFYLKSKIFCLTSFMEGFPNVLVEAMAYGCVPLAFDCITGPAEIIDNFKDGVLVQNSDFTGFSEQLKNMMDNPEKLKEMSLNAFSSAKKFSKENIFPRLEYLID